MVDEWSMEDSMVLRGPDNSAHKSSMVDPRHYEM